MLRTMILSLSILTLTSAMVIWPDLVNDESKLNRPKPTNWNEKNLGQWCRNFTVNQHTQCPQASPFHQFDCCGTHNTECCFAIQGGIIIFGSFCAAVACISLIFYLLLKFQMICLESTYPSKEVY